VLSENALSVAPMRTLETLKLTTRSQRETLPSAAAELVYRRRHSYGHAGNSSQVRPSSNRPARFFWTPPHCLKKNAT
jgi:hypothetical protein